PHSLFASLLFFVVTVICVSACPSKITKKNFDKIKNDMTLAEVEKILGEGTKQTDGSGTAAQFGVVVASGSTGKNNETYVWESGDSSITVYFGNGKVMNKTSKGL